MPLADRSDEELIAAETAFRLDLLRENDDCRTWVVAVDPEADPSDADPERLDPEDPAPVGVPDPDRDLAAFPSTSVDECPGGVRPPRPARDWRHLRGGSVPRLRTRGPTCWSARPPTPANATAANSDSTSITSERQRSTRGGDSSRIAGR
ncbi:hypothetical protein J2744_001787 [Halorubrum trapanicum]|uniref:Uncharacterized protein n=1 Tax=Halorubrum trapanicum TaxID=29284 RepID=A0A8J7UMG6_9EURY|nr:hypothetical protein [Halorubrum trapanicum]